MTFTCKHCGESINGVATVHNGKFLHHRCVEAYETAKAEEGLEETPMEIEE
jgi:hypothetical protein